MADGTETPFCAALGGESTLLLRRKDLLDLVGEIGYGVGLNIGDLRKVRFEGQDL